MTKASNTLAGKPGNKCGPCSYVNGAAVFKRGTAASTARAAGEKAKIANVLAKGSCSSRRSATIRITAARSKACYSTMNRYRYRPANVTLSQSIPVPYSHKPVQTLLIRPMPSVGVHENYQPWPQPPRPGALPSRQLLNTEQRSQPSQGHLQEMRNKCPMSGGPGMRL